MSLREALEAAITKASINTTLETEARILDAVVAVIVNELREVGAEDHNRASVWAVPAADFIERYGGPDPSRYKHHEARARRPRRVPGDLRRVLRPPVRLHDRTGPVPPAAPPPRATPT